MCEGCSARERRIKVLEADFEFQIKKLREDQAQEIVSIEMTLQKEIRKQQEKYMREHNEREEQNRQWITKHDRTLQEAQAELTLHQLASQALLKDEQAQQEQRIQRMRMESEREWQGKIKQQATFHEQMLRAIERRHAAEKEELEMRQNKEKARELNAMSGALNGQIEEYRERIEAITKESRLVMQNYEESSMSSKRLQSKLYEDLYALGNQNGRLKAELAAERRESEKLKEALHLKAIQIQVIQEQSAQQLTDLRGELEADRRRVEEELKGHITILLERELAKCEQYQQAVQSIEEKRTNQAELLRTSLNEVRVCLDSRPSRSTDTEMINQLRQCLAQREREYEVAQREAKEYRLELENKEETFNRMFVNANTISSNGSLGRSEYPERKRQPKARRPTGKSVISSGPYSFPSTTMIYGGPPEAQKKEKQIYLTKTSKVL